MGSLQMKDSNREAFEELIDIEIIISEGFKFNPNINQYYHPDHTNHRLSYAYLMGAWMVWQEKAQAVPGQICVTYERLQELIEIGVKAALEAQEPAKAQAVPDGFEIGRLQDRIVELLDERQELYAQLDAGCTEGFVLVPKEPTPKMIDAMDEFDCRNDYADMYNAYKAMIEAQEQKG